MEHHWILFWKTFPYYLYFIWIIYKAIKVSGKMAKKSTQVALQEEINSNDDWEKMLEKPGVYVVDVYSEWCGPCLSMVANIKRIKLEIGGDSLHFAIAKSDNVTVLERFRQHSEPHWIFFFDGKMVNIIIDANAPRLMKLITEEMEQYDKFKKGEIQREFLNINQITNEERRKMIENEHYIKQNAKKEKRIRDERMLKLREHALKKFAFTVQMKTCVVFFPHTLKYIMVEKPRAAPVEGEIITDEPQEPEMIEKRVCEVANACALMYEELIVIDAKEVQLTEDTLDEMFFADRKILESFPYELIDQMLNRKVFSVMLSLPKPKRETTEESADDELAEAINMIGVVEQRTNLIIYGNNDALNPNPKSLAAEHMLVNDSGEMIPSIFTPTNPLSKVSVLAVLFKKFCINSGYIVPQPPLPQYLIIFDIAKSNIVLPIIEDFEDKVVHYGFFRSADPENPRLLCKDPELLTTYGMDRIGKDAKLVLAVLKDDKDKSLLRFVDVGPIYVSPDSEVGIDDSNKYFPHDFDEIDGEVKKWLVSAQDEEAAVAAAAATAADEQGMGEGEEEMSDEEQLDAADQQQLPLPVAPVG